MENTLTSQQPLRPEDELQFIRKIIADSRASFVEDGKPYIVWGVLVAIGMTITYISALTEHDFYTGFIWIGLTLIGYAYIFYYVRKKKKQPARAQSFVDRIQGAIWGACGGSIGLVVLLLSFNYQFDRAFGMISPLYICFISSVILGIAYFLSGIANDLNWLRNVGFAWWAGAIAMYIWPTVHVLGIYAGMLLLFQVVPGLILQRRYKRITSQPTAA